ncbi:glycine--tRNA ligase, mitochondrial 1 [Olea europaea subsp. europaea]|uniref:Glycine--tRNA ligase, mitochondrial 1 n=1 Tax=Olea europaea subsp. europaea TaxID=158383 RepID=A0A8S0TMJ0_OLEEU|nr:glycine--tRNA ligase, mitochondrial 1 [Olea europaea subsp. europaea]
MKSSPIANAFSSKNPYDDVLLSSGGRGLGLVGTKLGVQDYTGIFFSSLSRSSSPILDISGLDERVSLYDHMLKNYCNDKLEKDLKPSVEKAVELRHVLAMSVDLSIEELGAKIKEYGFSAPDTKNLLSDPYPFNLMFRHQYIHLKIAEGIYLYYYNGKEASFATARIGQTYRNEFSNSFIKVALLHVCLRLNIHRYIIHLKLR